MKTKLILIKVLPKPILFLYRSLSNRKDLGVVISFLILKPPHISFSQRFYIIKQLYLISYSVHCAHTQYEMLSFIKEILSIPQDKEGCIVEAGSYKGGSTAKFSLAAKLVNRKLIVFDSFEGIPAHAEYSDKFPKGSYCGTIKEVKGNVKKFGAIEICEFVKGYFEATMPQFSQPIAAIYLDVDLVSSTKTCLRYLYPLLIRKGVLFSQDGHLPLVMNVFDDDFFWEKEVGCPKPVIEGLRKQKLLRMEKQ